jgi:hypothetical protein
MLRSYLPKFLRKVLQADSDSTSIKSLVPYTAAEQSGSQIPTPQAPIIEKTEIEQIIEKTHPYSMVLDSSIEFLIKAVQSVFNQQIAGDFVECRVSRNGCASAILCLGWLCGCRAEGCRQQRFEPLYPLDI